METNSPSYLWFYLVAKTEGQTRIPLLIKVSFVLLIILCICLMIALIVVTIDRDKHTKTPTDCKSQFTFDFSVSKDPDVFQDLSEDEIHAVQDYMLSVSSLNLTSHKKATLQDNFIYLVELYLPPKAEVLQYLDDKGSKPVRRARVVLQNGAPKIPNIEEYIVEPLPKPRNHSTLRLAGRQFPIPFHARQMTAQEIALYSEKMKLYSARLYKVLKESFGYWVHNCTTHCATPSINGIPGSFKPGTRQTWITFRRQVAGKWLHILPLELLLDHNDKDADKWKVLRVSASFINYSSR